MTNTNNKFTPGGFLKIMSFLHLGIAAAPVALGILFFTQSDNTQLNFSSDGDVFLMVVPLVAIGSIFLGDLVFRKIVQGFSDELSLRERLSKFQSAAIIKYAALEGAALFSLVIFSNTQNLTYLIIGVFLIFYLFLQRPTKDKIEGLLNLRGEQKAQFNQLNEPLD